MKIKIKNLQNLSKVNHRLITAAAKLTLASEKIGGQCELSILLVDDKHIKILNKKYLNANRATDVLAFQMDSFPKNNSKSFLLGDVVLSTETIRINARLFSVPYEKELIFCLIHGILHLIGYEDYTDKDREKMFKKQNLIIRQLPRKGVAF